MPEWKPIDTAPKDGWFYARLDRSKFKNCLAGEIVAAAYMEGDNSIEIEGSRHGYEPKCFLGWATSQDLGLLPRKAFA